MCLFMGATYVGEKKCLHISMYNKEHCPMLLSYVIIAMMGYRMRYRKISDFDQVEILDLRD